MPPVKPESLNRSYDSMAGKVQSLMDKEIAVLQQIIAAYYSGKYDQMARLVKIASKPVLIEVILYLTEMKKFDKKR